MMMIYLKAQETISNFIFKISTVTNRAEFMFGIDCDMCVSFRDLNLDVGPVGCWSWMLSHLYDVRCRYHDEHDKVNERLISTQLRWLDLDLIER